MVSSNRSSASDYELYAEARSAIIAEEVRRREGVHLGGFRDVYLPAGKCFSPSQVECVQEWVEQVLEVGDTGYTIMRDSTWDQRSRGFGLDFTPRHAPLFWTPIPSRGARVLQELQSLSGRLSEQWPWTPGQASWFVVTNETPLIPSMSARLLPPKEYDPDTGELIPSGAWRVELVIDPALSPTRLAEEYEELRSRLMIDAQHGPRRPSDRKSVLVSEWFLWKRTAGKDIEAEQPGQSIARFRDWWNGECRNPKATEFDKDWVYEGRYALGNFRRDLRDGIESILWPPSVMPRPDDKPLEGIGFDD